MFECWVPLIRDIILAIAGVIGACVAILGLNTWKRQLYGQSEYDLARRILKSLYLFREAMNNARANLMEYSAIPDLPKDQLEQLSKEEKEYWAIRQEFTKRWEPIGKARAELDTNILESEVFWGNEIKEKIAKLSLLYAKWFVAVREHLERTNPRDPDETYSVAERKANNAIIYGGSGRTNDAFLDEMLTAIEDIEIVLKPYMKKGK